MVARLLIVVPARGGSKGLPRKNIRELAGLPLLGWTAEAVRFASVRESRCLLSTDDAEIAEVARRVGLDVPFLRAAELATDTATAESVALDALDWVTRQEGTEPDMVMLLQPTSPFRPPAVIAEAARLIQATAVDAVIGVKPLHRTPATLYRAGSEMSLTPLGAREDHRSRRQDASDIYTPNGAMYAIRSRVLRAETTFFPERIRGLAMGQVESLDIDDQLDWDLAQAAVAAGLTWRS